MTPRIWHGHSATPSFSSLQRKESPHEDHPPDDPLTAAHAQRSYVRGITDGLRLATVFNPAQVNLNPVAQWVAYLLGADNSIGPLLSRLRGAQQPVVRPRNAFSAPRSHLLAR